jgi:hypothetical protein
MRLLLVGVASRPPPVDDLLGGEPLGEQVDQPHPGGRLGVAGRRRRPATPDR